MKFLIFTRPIEGIEKKLPHPQEFEAQIGWIPEQLHSGRFDCAYHGENHAVAIVNAESRENWSSSMALCRWLNSPTARLKRSGVSSIKCREFWKLCVSIIYARVE